MQTFDSLEWNIIVKKEKELKIMLLEKKLLYVSDVDSLNGLIDKLKSIDGIEEVRRI